MKRLVLAIALLVLAAPAWSQDERNVTVTFHTEPAGARVWVMRDGDWDYLARSGDRVTLAVLPNQILALKFTLEGWQERQESIHANRFLEGLGRWPRAGVIQLEPESAWVLGRYHALHLAPYFLVLALVAVMLYLRAVRPRLRRLRRLEELQAVMAVHADELVGATLGAYRMERRLGKGGMAVVYRAVPGDTLDDEQAVAVKVLTRQFSEDEAFRKRWEREINICKALHHPNIVKLIDWGDGEGFLYLVMELIDGETLTSRMTRPMEPEEALEILSSVMDAVHYANGMGVAHRDLKPDNIMLTRRGLVKVMDFGMARKRDYGTVTLSGQVMGTPAYMSPEQAQSRAFTEDRISAVDQYSLGVMAYELLAGRRPFEDADPVKVIVMHISQTPADPREHDPNIPAALAAVVLKLMSKRPEERYDSMEAARLAMLKAAGNVV